MRRLVELRNTPESSISYQINEHDKYELVLIIHEATEKDNGLKF